jgi:hypothetical protein
MLFCNKQHLKTISIFAISITSIVGCATAPSECYTPVSKQGYEKQVCYKYDDSLTGNHRFVYMGESVWMQYAKPILIESRDFNMTVNGTNHITADKYTILHSDHPLAEYSSLMVNLDFLTKFDKVSSLSYTVLPAQNELEPQKLTNQELTSLNNILALAKQTKKETNATKPVNMQEKSIKP